MIDPFCGLTYETVSRDGKSKEECDRVADAFIDGKVHFEPTGENPPPRQAKRKKTTMSKSKSKKSRYGNQQDESPNIQTASRGCSNEGNVREEHGDEGEGASDRAGSPLMAMR